MKISPTNKDPSVVAKYLIYNILMLLEILEVCHLHFYCVNTFLLERFCSTTLLLVFLMLNKFIDIVALFCIWLLTSVYFL